MTKIDELVKRNLISSPKCDKCLQTLNKKCKKYCAFYEMKFLINKENDFENRNINKTLINL